ncbi:MAG TPA: hypothetical protein VD766_06605 [Solirubrobacterales bacterium]|nr:hypothetical protein [Solirubrobacterales bacterium]
MPDEEGNDAIDEAPETPLHAHGSGVEEENDRPREDQAEGNVVEEGEDSADAAEKTGGATSGGPPGAEASEDPSNVEHDPND